MASLVASFHVEALPVSCIIPIFVPAAMAAHHENKFIKFIHKTMKQKILTFLMAILFGLTPCSAKIGHLLPKPQEVTRLRETAFSLGRQVRLTDPTNCVPLQEFLTEKSAGITEDASAPTITVEIVSRIDDAYDYELAGYPAEAYTLEVHTNTVHIRAADAIGVVRAAQTLAQLAEGYDGTAELEACTIKDWPAFKLRGYMHDVGRSFISYEELKHQIDLLARFKVNTFHWHLTDNQGFRFEVKAYPQLRNASSMGRFPGQYYTQEQCTELEAYAHERGVTIIPEIDMPGHSEAFTTAMGYNMSSAQGQTALKKIIQELAAAFPHAPYIHLGFDETAVSADFISTMVTAVKNEGKLAACWDPYGNGSIPTTSMGVSLLSGWSSRAKDVNGIPFIDSRYNYVNHFDVFADLVGIYKSNIDKVECGNPNVAGTVSAYWNDRKTPTQEDIIKQNNFYANVLASTERAWIGGGKQYIESGGTTLPNSGEEYEAFADWEERFLFHKAHSLQNEPIPYVRQSNVRWIITDAFPNGGNASMQFPPETEGLKDAYTYNGDAYGTARATGAGIYLRHTWGNVVPSFYTNPSINSTAYAWTYVYSPQEQEAGALIEFQNYGRSEKDTAPDNGKWDRKGSRIWLNDTELLPGEKWTNAGKSITNEVDLRNENFTARTPLKVQLKQGWNKVFLKLPYVNASGVRLNKWMFTFVLTDKEGRNALDGLVYSPTQSIDEDVENLVIKISEMRALERSVCKDQPGYYPTSIAQEMADVIAEIEQTFGNASITPEQRQQQMAQLEAAFSAFKTAYKDADIIQPKASTDDASYWYKMWTPGRDNRHASVSNGTQGGSYYLTGEAPATDASYWKFVKRTDGTWNIISRSGNRYIWPEIISNTKPMIKLSDTEPSAGWTLKPAETVGMVIFTSGTVELNQTNGGTSIGWNGGTATVPSYSIINWGSGTNTTDAGCTYLIEEVDLSDLPDPGPTTDEFTMIVPTTITEGQFAKDTRWYTLLLNKSYPVRNPGTASYISLEADELSFEDKDLWCFVGDSINGFKIYNKEEGTSKILVSPKTMSGTTGATAYPVMRAEAGLNTNTYEPLWVYEASTDITDDGGSVIYLEQKGTRYGANNRDQRLAFWTTGKDHGSSFAVHTGISTYKVDPGHGTMTSNSPSTFKANWASSINKPTLTLTHSNNNMLPGDDGETLVLYDATNGNYTLTAGEGYIVTGYSFDFTATKAMTVTPDGGNAVSNTANGWGTVSVEGLEKEAARFVLSGSGNITVSNFYVTIRRDIKVDATRRVVFKTNPTGTPYRIPALARTKNNELIAVVDYRYCKADIGNGPIDLRYKISSDNGNTWSEEYTNLGDGDDSLTGNAWNYAFGDPSIVADRESDEVMVMCVGGHVGYFSSTRNNPQHVVRFRSHDGGRTWDKGTNITEQIYGLYDGKLTGGGSPAGIFLTSGKIMQSRYVKVGNYYRLYIAHPMRTSSNRAYATMVIYSDDFGETWKVLGNAGTKASTAADESKVEELPDGRVLLSCRNQSGGRKYNVFTYTDANAATGTWSTDAMPTNMTANEVNACNGGILVVKAERIRDGKQVHVALQSVPLSSTRVNVGFYYKEVENRTDYFTGTRMAANWVKGLQVSETSSCYSTMVQLSNDSIGFLYEENNQNGGFDIIYKQLSIEDITNGVYRAIDSEQVGITFPTASAATLSDKEVYDLQGRRVLQDARRGIFIVGNRKVIR